MANELKIQIPKPNIQMIKVAIEGTNPLIFHKWDKKAIQMIEDKQQKKAKANTREARNPDQEAEESYYKTRDGKIAFPALSIKQAMVGAARSLNGVPMTLLRGAVFVTGDVDGLVEVKYKEKSKRTDMVRIGMGSADVRYRGQVTDWKMDLIIKFNADVLSAEQVVNLLQTAGFSCGLGEWRPERNGDYGTFQVAS